VVDLLAGRTIRTIEGLSEPQGVLYEAASDAVYVANAGDGSVRLLHGEDLAPIGRIELGDDADNVRLDAPRQRVVVGYGKGGLAIIDPVSRAKIADIRLPRHPESFQIAENGTQLFVNVPNSRQVAIVELASGTVRSVPTGDRRTPMPWRKPTRAFIFPKWETVSRSNDRAPQDASSVWCLARAEWAGSPDHCVGGAFW
jgi:hypothetical protein